MMPEPRVKAKSLSVGICGQGVCIDMLDRRGKVICHAHGFDAVDFLAKLREAILTAATEPAEGERVN